MSAIRALLVFSLLSAVYLVYLGVGRELVGILLWPAASGYAALTILSPQLAQRLGMKLSGEQP